MTGPCCITLRITMATTTTTGIPKINIGFCLYYLLVTGYIFHTYAESLHYGCEDGKHYSEVGKQDIIDCHVPINFKAVYWYNISGDIQNPPPIAGYVTRDMTKLGSEYEARTMDILSNGSLFINNVTKYHDGRLKLVYIEDNGHISTSFVTVISFIRPKKSDPVIGKCDDKVCFQHSSETTTVICNVNGAKPPADLSWVDVSRLEEEGRVRSRIDTSKNDDGSFNTFSMFNVDDVEKNLLSSLICTSLWIVANNSHNASLIIDSSDQFYEVEPDIDRNVLLEVDRSRPVKCGEKKSLVNVWKKVEEDGSLTVLAWRGMGASKIVSQESHYDIMATGELVFQRVKLTDEGLYVCVYDDGISDYEEHISITVAVPPEPLYPTISECDDITSCTVSGDSGTLTCSLFGVKPVTTLEWQFDEAIPIKLKKKREQILTNGNLFDVSIAVDYEVTAQTYCTDSFVVKCVATDPVHLHFYPYSEVTVTPGSSCVNDTTTKNSVQSHADALKNEGFVVWKKPVPAIVGLIIGVLVVMVIGEAVYILYLRKAMGTRTGNEQGDPAKQEELQNLDPDNRQNNHNEPDQSTVESQV